MLIAVIKDIKKDSLDTSRHSPAINKLDLAKVKESKAFYQQLQEKVFFYFQYIISVGKGGEILNF